MHQPQIEIKVEKDDVSSQKGSSTIPPHENEENSRFKSQIQKANFLSQLKFFYALNLVLRCFQLSRKGGSLTEQDLITFPWKNRADVLANRVTHFLGKQFRKNAKLSLSLAILNAIKVPFILTLLCQTTFSFLKIFSGWAMKKLIDCYVGVSDSDDAYKWAGVLSACFILGFYTQHHFDHVVMTLPNHIKNALTNLIYNKITRLSMSSLTEISSGKLINLASNDISILEQRSMFFTNLIVGTLSVIAGGAVLWTYFGVCCLVGLGYLVVWVPIQQIVFITSHKAREKTTELTDHRVRLISETVDSIRLLKMYTWELKFKEKIAALRRGEVKLLRIGAIVQALADAISFSSLPVSSFLMYIAYVYTGGDLTVSTVFSSYYILGFLRLHASFFVQLGLGFATEIKLVLNRIQKVLETPDFDGANFEEPYEKTNAVEFENYSGYWTEKKKPQNSKTPVPDQQTLLNSQPVLQDVNMHIRRGTLNALVGRVGSGKTSFLLSLIGEIPTTVGKLRSKGNVAYVEQEPTLFAGTLRENVLFGKPFDQEHYDKVVKACSLDNDLKLFPKGDLSEIVEGGNNLSGGQKARLALARAVYSNSDIYLLDDPLSAVDPKVARTIYDNAIEGVLKGKTIILVTHQVDFARRCENIIVMEGGQILGNGKYEDLGKQNAHIVDRVFGSLKTSVKEEDDEGELAHKQLQIRDPTETNNGKTQNTTPKDDKKSSSNQETEQSGTRPKAVGGEVTLQTYMGLFKEMGGVPLVSALLISCLICEFANVGYGRMLGAWVSGTFAQWKTVAILGGLAGFNVLMHILKFLMVTLSLLKASRSLHIKMLNRVIQATVLFFDTNPVGQIVSRFSNDIGALDRFFPLAITDILNISYVIASTIITVSIIDPVLLAPLGCVVIFTGFMLWLCYPSVSLTKQYEMTTRDPAFGLFSATLAGTAIIRIYNQGENFRKRFSNALHLTLKGNVAYSLAGRFMGFYCDMAYNIAVVACIFVITARSGRNPDAGYLAAFALALICSITGILQHGLRQLTQLNIFMSATSRIQAYSNLESEPPLTLETDEAHKKANWPQQGKIDFNKVYMKYSPEADYVIRDLNLNVKPGQKVGCVGRTGAGKTSIVQLLYRMREIDKKGLGSEDSYINIDDVNTQSLGLHLLRNKISVIPQFPIIFTGTIRMNVDPLGEFSDEEVWKALQDVRLKDHVEKQAEKLNTNIATPSAVFSVGQKQLICLARAILKPSNVLIMDEATANMDHDTDNFLQQTIKEKFASSSQFTIAHRLVTIANYDRVLVLDKGRKMEFEEPYKLLVNKIGDTSITNEGGYFATMVLNTGPISSKRIFDIARKTYFERHGTGAQ